MGAFHRLVVSEKEQPMQACVNAFVGHRHCRLHRIQTRRMLQLLGAWMRL